MKTFPKSELITFLRQELAVPGESIKLGLRQVGNAHNLLPMVLWQYGLVSTHQLDQIFEWLENRPPSELSPTA